MAAGPCQGLNPGLSAMGSSPWVRGETLVGNSQKLQGCPFLGSRARGLLALRTHTRTHARTHTHTHCPCVVSWAQASCGLAD